MRIKAGSVLPLRNATSPYLEATTGFEPVMAVLQTAAFPLGYVAATFRPI
jgi:hypothetical protein